MTMQLFSFGHPCEHQLRRSCIGGSSCPLNGYPDNWCCSYIKGKINFKRDKPCEGLRCRWGFTHPTQTLFDAVTQVLNESRPIAAKIDEAEDTDLLSFHIDNQHIVDTVQCALHMMRHPPSSCARRVGQLLACAAVKAGDQKVFMQLLKTMKKPVDNYILGAYAYLTQGNTPSSGGGAGAQAGGKGKKPNAKEAKKDDVADVLKNDMVDLMNAALSQGGHLVDREDQHTLQATFIQALKQYPKGNKKRMEMLEAAVAKFGNRKPSPTRTASTTTAAAAITATEAADGSTTTAAATPPSITSVGNKSISDAPPPAAATEPPQAAAAALSSVQAAPVAAAQTTGLASSVTSQVSPTHLSDHGRAVQNKTPTLAPTPQQAATPQQPKPEELTASAIASAAKRAATGATPKRGPEGVATPSVESTTPQKHHTPSLPSAATPSLSHSQQQQQLYSLQQAQQAQQAAVVAPPQRRATVPVIGSSQLSGFSDDCVDDIHDHYVPIRTDEPLHNMLILGGLFSLTQEDAAWSTLGLASCTKQARSLSIAAVAASLPAALGIHPDVVSIAMGTMGPGAPQTQAQQMKSQRREPTPPITETIFGTFDAGSVFDDIDPRLIWDSIEDDW